MSQNIFADLLDHVLDTDNVRNHEKYLQGRVTSGSVFGKEASLRVQYCVGGFFVEGWIHNMKIRMYGAVYGGYHIYFCHVSETIDEVNTKGNYTHGGLPRTNWKKDLLELVEQKINEFPAEAA